MRKTAKERREALKKRTKRGVKERGKKGLGKKSILNFSELGDKKIHRYQMKTGTETNTIDILPYIITQKWYKDLREKTNTPTELDVGYEDYKLEIPVHKNVGDDNDTVLCLRLAFGKKCILCEERFAEYNKDKDKQDKEIISDNRPQWRTFYNVYDYDEPEKDIQLFDDVAYGNFEDMLIEARETDSDGLAAFSDLEKGKTVEFRARDKSYNDNPYQEAHSIKFIDREAYEESILDDVFPLDAMLIVHTPDEITRLHLGLDENENPINDAPKPEGPPNRELKKGETQPSRRKPRNRPAKTETEPDDIPASAEPGCPEGGKFGEDCNALEECAKCDEDRFQSCVAKQDELTKEKEAKENMKTDHIKEEKPPVRRRRNRK